MSILNWLNALNVADLSTKVSSSVAPICINSDESDQIMSSMSCDKKSVDMVS